MTHRAPNFAIAAFAAVFFSFGVANAKANDRAVHFTWRGDDGLTLRFVEALRDALTQVGIDTSAGSEEFGVYVAGNLRWEVTEEGKYIYPIVVATGASPRFLEVSNPTCLEDEIVECADRIARELLEYFEHAPPVERAAQPDR